MTDMLIILGIVGVPGAWLLFAVVDAHSGGGGHAGAAMFVFATLAAMALVLGLTVMGALWGHWVWQWIAGVWAVLVVLGAWGVWKEIR